MFVQTAVRATPASSKFETPVQASRLSSSRGPRVPASSLTPNSISIGAHRPSASGITPQTARQVKAQAKRFEHLGKTVGDGDDRQKIAGDIAHRRSVQVKYGPVPARPQVEWQHKDQFTGKPIAGIKEQIRVNVKAAKYHAMRLILGKPTIIEAGAAAIAKNDPTGRYRAMLDRELVATRGSSGTEAGASLVTTSK